MRAVAVIPAHNEAATIESVVRGCLAHAPVIVVDDGSSDNTGDLARAAGALVTRNDLGLGYDGAIERGFLRAAEEGFEAVVTLDADGQHDPALLPLFLEKLAAVDLVIGIRPAPARLAERLFGLYTNRRHGVRDILCGMKGYRMELYQAHGCFDSTRSIGTELALWALRAGRSFAVLDVPVRPRLDRPRFGNRLRANWAILKALGRAVLARDDQPK